MEEKKLTNEEVIKALDICYTSPCCTNECPYFNKNGRNFCVENKALKDMKRIVQEHAEQQAEIERLKEQCSKSSYKDSWKNKFFKAQAEIERLTEEGEARESDLKIAWADMEDSRQKYHKCYREKEELQKQVDELKETIDERRNYYEKRK